MKIQKLDDGTLLVPKRIESEGIVGDTVREIKPDNPEYENYLQQFSKEQQLEKEMMNNLGTEKFR